MDKTKKPEEIFDMIYPRLRESDFRDVYLPMLLNGDEAEGRIRWIEEVAKKPAMRVNICSDKDRNEILFWVPPIVNPFPTVVHNGFERVARDYDKTASRFNEDIAMITFSKSLEGVVDASETPKEFIDQWNFILKRFGYAEADKEPVKETPQLDDDDYEEDW